MRIVACYKPFKPESDIHRALPFDWIGALRMLSESAEAKSGLKVYALTDETTTVPVPAFRYASRETRLMLWILDVWAQYLASDDFYDDTILLSPDMLVLDDLRRHVQPADLGILLRTNEKFSEVMPLLNGVQFWRHSGKSELATFFRMVHARAAKMPETLVRWGADTQAMVDLLEPLRVGYSYRHGLKVYGYDASSILRPLRAVDVRRMESGKPPKPMTEPILDFRAMRKDHMARYYATYCHGVAA